MDSKTRLATKRIELLQRKIKGCTGCHLHLYCQSPVPPQIPAATITPQLLIIGEAPGASEDKQGEPFVGAAGKLLEKVLRIGMGLSRKQVIIANGAQCRPTVAQAGKQNRAPSNSELESCRDNVARIVDYYVGVGGEWVLLLGATALKQFVPWMKVGQWSGRPFVMQHRKRLLNMMPTYHPAAALRDDRHVETIIKHLKYLQGLKRGTMEWPYKCFCGKSVAVYDEMGIPYCREHGVYRRGLARVMEVRKEQLVLA